MITTDNTGELLWCFIVLNSLFSRLLQTGQCGLLRIQFSHCWTVGPNLWQQGKQGSPGIWLGIPHHTSAVGKLCSPCPRRAPRTPPKMESLKTHSVIPDKWLPALSNHTYTYPWMVFKYMTQYRCVEAALFSPQVPAVSLAVVDVWQ